MDVFISQRTAGSASAPRHRAGLGSADARPCPPPPQRKTPQVSGVGRKVSPLVTLAITTAATTLLDEGTIVFGASFSRRKQKWVKMA